MQNEYFLLVLADSALPCGGFVASAGLECASQLGLVNPRDQGKSLLNIIHASLDAYCNMQLKFMADAWNVTVQQLAPGSKFTALLSLDEELNAFLVGNSVSRNSSISQGGGLLVLASNCLRPQFKEPEFQSILAQFKSATREAQWPSSNVSPPPARTPGHHAVVLGFILGALGLSLKQAKRMALFWHCRTLVSASVRLNVIGPFQGQSLLLHLYSSVEERVNGSDAADEISAIKASTSPLIETVTSSHGNIYSRMFNS